jgi:GT2 family glycosyltransferase
VSGPGADEPVPVAASAGETALTVDGPRCDVINNAGGVVLTDGYGADRGLGTVDDGRFDTADEVLAACGNGLALRTVAGRQAGWFDDAFFVYYEDTDLCWRLRLLGWHVRYVPRARLRHFHAATSGIGSDLFRFHTERNRLLMLTKNASAALAARAVLRFPLTTASLAVRQWPDTRLARVRLRAFASYLRLLPAMLQQRRRLAASALVARRDPERFLIPAARFHRDAG